MNIPFQNRTYILKKSSFDKIIDKIIVVDILDTNNLENKGDNVCNNMHIKYLAYKL